MGAGIVRGGVPGAGVKELKTKPNGTMSLKVIPVASTDQALVRVI